MQETGKKYNLLIITPDQMRADYLGCYGHHGIGTKHIDALAQNGVRFDRCYCAAPLCGPSRISFATSTYFSEHNHRNYWSTISPGVPNIVKSLKQEGYRTGMFGKNHLFTYDRLPEVWDELDEICVGNYDGHPDYEHSFSSFTLAEDDEYNITGRLTDETISFIEDSKQPFFAWVNYQDPHPAFCCPEPYASMFDPDDIELPETYENYDDNTQPQRNEVWRAHSEMEFCTDEDMKRTIAYYMGQVRYVDDSVGRIVDALKQTGKEKDTVILFFSDHGELLGDYGMTHKNPTFYDCLTRIPTIIVAPEGRWQGVCFNGLTEEVDLTPSILDILGIDIPPTMVGRSWVNDLDNKDYSGKDTILCEAGAGAPTLRAPIEGLVLKAPRLPTSFGPGAMIRKGDMKLSIYADDRCELYDLSVDPNELNNLYDDPSCANVRSELTLALLRRVLSVKIRDVGLDWKYDKYPYDVRFEPLENSGPVLKDVRFNPYPTPTMSGVNWSTGRNTRPD